MNNVLSLTKTGEFGIAEFFISITFSLFCGYLLMVFYRMYFSRAIERNESLAKSFVFIAPAVSAIFWAIQYSLPLSLGLLGALSFVRFRTPIKKSEDIGFILTVIAVSLLSSVYRFYAAGILLFVIFFVTAAKTFLTDGRLLPMFKSGKTLTLFIATKGKNIDEIHKKVEESVRGKFKNISPKDIVLSDVIPENEGYHLRYTLYAKPFVSRHLPELIGEVNRIDGVIQAEVFCDKSLSE